MPELDRDTAAQQRPFWTAGGPRDRDPNHRQISNETDLPGDIDDDRKQGRTLPDLDDGWGDADENGDNAENDRGGD